MRFSSVFAAGALAALAVASPLASYAVHEKRDAAPVGWSKREVLDRRAVLPMRIALTQRNLDKGYGLLEEVSHPSSTKYGKHFSAAEVAEMFSPRYVKNKPTLT